MENCLTVKHYTDIQCFHIAAVVKSVRQNIPKQMLRLFTYCLLLIRYVPDI